MKVSVILLTYNHEKYVAQAIEGILMQETDFDFEILITEDCSTDGTREILYEFQRQHPERIRLLLSPRNLCTNEVFTRAWEAVRGEYLAFLDGDDFWCSARKLKRQADVLDDDPSCAICFHQVGVLYPDGSYDPQFYTATDQKPVATLDDLWRDNFIASCSVMIRRSALPELPSWYLHAAFGDWPLYLLAAQHGHILFLDEVMATYRSHGTGLWSRLSRAEQLETTIQFLKQMDRNFGYEHTAPISTRMAELGYDQALVHLENGSQRDARRAFVRALALDPIGRRVPRKRMLAVLWRVVHGR